MSLNGLNNGSMNLQTIGLQQMAPNNSNSNNNEQQNQTIAISSALSSSSSTSSTSSLSTTIPTLLVSQQSNLTAEQIQQQQLLQKYQFTSTIQPTQHMNVSSPSNINLKLNNASLQSNLEQFHKLSVPQQSQYFIQPHENHITLLDSSNKQIGRLKIKQTGIDIISLEIENIPNYEIVTHNISNSKKFYFKGLINSIGKVPNICEDSHFLSKDFTTVGVADGVGSWRSVGVDAGEYSRFLMNNIYNLALLAPYLKPYELIETVYKESIHIPGSSTICILKVIGSKVYSGLIGDSSYIIIRKDQIFYRSNEQTHKPNYPFQLGQNSNDKPSSGIYLEHTVLENDIFVIGTDGFFDNIFDHEILNAIKEVSSIEHFFNHLLELAKTKSQDPNCSTPIATRNQTKGGKPDDITVGCFVISKFYK